MTTEVNQQSHSQSSTEDLTPHPINYSIRGNCDHPDVDPGYPNRRMLGCDYSIPDTICELTNEIFFMNGFSEA